MNQIMIDGKTVKTERDFHNMLAVQCGVVGFYGCNLDALWDLLAYGVERPTCIIWHDSESSKNSMGSSFCQIVYILQRVKEQDESLGWADRFDYVLK